MKPWTFSIDIVGTCNLRCPSCPVGNSPNRNPVGLMSIELFAEILDKISENKEIVPKIDLYNWGEPSLHKRLPEFIHEVNKRGWFSNISSNLSVPNIDHLIEVPPSKIRVSVSGFEQSSYGVTHIKGDIKLVKSNWYRLLYLKAKSNANTVIEVAFHLYKDNKRDLLQWASLAQQAGAVLSPVWALYQPLEDLVDLALEGKMSDAYVELKEKMEVDPLAQMALGRKSSPLDCRLRSKQTAINFDGSVALCCGVYDSRKFTVASSFINTDWNDLQNRKYNHEFCKKCFSAGGPGTLSAEAWSGIDSLAISNQTERGADIVASIADGVKLNGKIDYQELFFAKLG